MELTQAIGRQMKKSSKEDQQTMRLYKMFVMRLLSNGLLIVECEYGAWVGSFRISKYYSTSIVEGKKVCNHNIDLHEMDWNHDISHFT